MNLPRTLETRSGSGLSRDQVATLQARLLSEKEALSRRLAERRRTLAEAPAREIEDADWASDSANQSLAIRLIDRDTKLLQEIEAALRRIGSGDYGICELTGEPIGFDRLAVRPWTRYAVVAKEEVERRRVGADSDADVKLDAA